MLSNPVHVTAARLRIGMTPNGHVWAVARDGGRWTGPNTNGGSDAMGQAEARRNNRHENSDGHRQLRVRRGVRVEVVVSGTNARRQKSQLLDQR